MVLSDHRRTTEIVEESAVRELARNLRGNVIPPRDPRYEDARQMFNVRVNRRPALIVQPADAGDVATALSFARRNDLPLAARGGGHSTPGFSTVDDGLLIDLSLLKSVTVDPVKRIAVAGGGLRAGEYISQTERYGLVSPIGDSAHTGLGGLTLGGGYGWLTGPVGMTIDRLLAAEVVTADGIVRRASTDENPDLFWALRGGSGNFGVVTHFEFDLDPISQVYGGMLVYPYERAGDVLRLYRDFTASAPDSVTTYAFIATPPGQPSIVGIMPVHVGDPAEGERILAPFRALGPVADMVGPMPYSGMTKLTEAFVPPGMEHENRWPHLTALSDGLLDTLIELGAPEHSHGGTLMIREMNGAAQRVAPDAMAFPHRAAPYSVVPLAMWPVGVERAPHIGWVDSVIEAIRPNTTGIYVNGSYPSDDPFLVYGRNFTRLVELKNRYDPENLFHGNYNIVPTIG